MDRLNQLQNNINNSTRPMLTWLKGDIVNVLLTLTFAMYAGKFAMPLSADMIDFLSQTPVRIAYLSLIVYMSGINPLMSILLAVGAFIVLSRIRGDAAVETYGEVNRT